MAPAAVNLHLSTSPIARLFTASGALRGWLQSSMFGASRAPLGRLPVDDGAAGRADECRRSMRSVLETQIIPRLLLANREGALGAAHGGAPIVPHDDIVALARLSAAGDLAGASQIVTRLRAHGLELDSVLVDLIGPAARHLGQQWEDDRMSFADVTLGLMRMHELIHTLGYEYHAGPQEAGVVRRVMLASAPGSQHILGLSIVSEFFRKAGWQVVLEVSPSQAELCRAVTNEWFDLVGLSVALDAQLPGLPGLVAALKSAARNPATPILLGGPVFSLRSLQAGAFGAQGICLDARESVDLAASLLSA